MRLILALLVTCLAGCNVVYTEVNGPVIVSLECLVQADLGQPDGNAGETIVLLRGK